ncbi:MAG: hypothetical protein ACI8TQ_002989 [Planctomycetota bacterium]|jgi:hypothetical protein
MSSQRDLSNFEIHRQPDDTTCGPTCLHGVYQYYGQAVALDDLLEQVPTLEGGGTLGVLLATHALRHGYTVKLITWNIQVFDPTWFDKDAGPLQEKLRRRAEVKNDARMTRAVNAYVDFLDEGGKIEYHDLEPALLRKYLNRNVPILTGLSATFLYRESRERAEDNQPDDIAGDPAGHFVVLTGYEKGSKQVEVNDPLYPNPLAEEHAYLVNIQRLIGAIYLGVLTYDANLIVIEPRKRSSKA